MGNNKDLRNGEVKQEFLELSGNLIFVYKKKREIARKLSELSDEYNPIQYDLLDSNDPRGQSWAEMRDGLKQEVEEMRESDFPSDYISPRLSELRTKFLEENKNLKKEFKKFSDFLKQAEQEGVDDYLFGELESIAEDYKFLKKLQ